jgi:peptidoglycan/LPS O-acetylase OafA/YrhL
MTQSTITGARKPNERFIGGDPLRGIACLVVVFWHVAVATAQITGQGQVSPGFRAELGIFGPPTVHLLVIVWFFFALSGYLIARPFLAAVVVDGARRPSVAKYARNRVLRIVPGYWAILTLTLLIVGLEGDKPLRVALFYVASHVYWQGPFTERMVQAWTLDVEVVFYVLTPLVLMAMARLLRDRGTPWLRAGLILAGCAVVAAASIALGKDRPADQLVPLGAAWAFTPGIALATIEPLVRDRLDGRTLGRWIAYGLLAAGLGAMAAHTYLADGGRGQDLLAAIACGSFLGAPLVWQWTTRGCWSILDRRWLHWFGIRAYGVYLVHVLAIYELRHVTRSFDTMAIGLLVTFPLVMALSTLGGALSFRFVEEPFLQRRLPWRSAKPPAEPAPEPAAPALTGAAAETTA